MASDILEFELAAWAEAGYIKVLEQNEGPFGLRYVIDIGHGDQHITEDELRWLLMGFAVGNRVERRVAA